MARKLSLRKVPVPNGAGEPEIFSYGQMMRDVLAWARPGQGMVLDEVLRALKAIEPLDNAMAIDAEDVVLTEEQYRTLIEKLAIYPFPMAHKLYAEFGIGIREAPEITS